MQGHSDRFGLTLQMYEARNPARQSPRSYTLLATRRMPYPFAFLARGPFKPSVGLSGTVPGMYIHVQSQSRMTIYRFGKGSFEEFT